MKRYALFVIMVTFITSLVLFSCKESDTDGFSVIPATGESQFDDKPDDDHPIDELIIYEEGGIHDGALGGRTGADQLCADSPNKPSEKFNSIAFLSVNSSDELANLPMNHYFPGDVPIRSLTGQQVAYNWGDMMDNILTNTLFDFDVLPTATFFWSGGISGDESSFNETCTNFTSNGTTGTAGGADVTNSWLDTTPSSPCNIPQRLLCLAY